MEFCFIVFLDFLLLRREGWIILKSMKIILASANEHKKEEFSKLFLNDELVLPKGFECEENGTSFVENALIKANALKALYPEACIMADDSGLIVDALPGQLGIHTARYGSDVFGRMLSASEKNEFLIKNLENVAWDKRTAHFVCCLVFMKGQITYVVQETIDGHIDTKQEGSGGFGYDPVFYVDGYEKTMATLGTDVKTKISHRAKAANKMSLLLDTIRGEENE